jgi:hypothetical protein
MAKSSTTTKTPELSDSESTNELDPPADADAAIDPTTIGAPEDSASTDVTLESDAASNSTTTGTPQPQEKDGRDLAQTLSGSGAETLTESTTNLKGKKRSAKTSKVDNGAKGSSTSKKAKVADGGNDKVGKTSKVNDGPKKARVGEKSKAKVDDDDDDDDDDASSQSIPFQDLPEEERERIRGECSPA